MSDDSILLSLEADAESVVAAFDEIDAGASAVEEALSQMASTGDEAISGMTSMLDEMTSMYQAAADEALGFTDANDALATSLSEDTAIIDALNESIANLEAQLAVLTVEETGTAEAAQGAGASMVEMAGEAEEGAGAVTGMGDALQAAMGPLLMISTVAVAGGAIFAKMGMDAQDSLTIVQSYAGASAAQMGQYTDALEKQGMQFGETLDQEAQGLYMVTSAGFQNADAINVEKQAVEDAKGAHIDLATATYALTGSMNAYGASAKDAQKYNDIMATAVTEGSQTFGDFARSIHTAAVAGAAAHIPFEMVAAAEATLTQQSIPARQATTDLAFLMRAMTQDVDKLGKTASGLGLNFNKTAYSSMNLYQQMQYLQKITGGNQAELSKLLGGKTGLTAFNALMVKNADGTSKFSNNIKGMGESAGKAAYGFEASEQTISSHMEKIGAAISIFAYKVVDALGPKLIPILDKVSGAIGQFSDFIINHTSQAMPILAGLAAVIGGAVVGAIAALVASMGTVLLALAAFGVAVGLVTALVQSHANLISNAFGQMARNAEQHTLEMKLQTNQHTLDMAKDNIGNIEMQQHGIEQEMEKTHSASTRHMLQMKLDALQQSLEQEQGVVKNAQHQREGIEAQLTQLVPSAHLHQLQMKDDALKNSKEQAEGTIDSIKHERAEIEQEMIKTRYASTRHMLGMKLDALDASQKQAEGVVKNIDKQQKGVESSMSKLRSQMAADNGNIIIQALHVWDSLRTGIGGAINGIMPILRGIGSFLQSTFVPVWQQLVQTFQTQLKPAWNDLVKAVQPIMPELQGFAELIGGLVVGVIVILVSILAGLIKAFANVLSGVIIVFGGIVKIISGAIQVISGVIAFFVDLLTGKWNKIGSDITTIAGGWVRIFGGIWDVIRGVFIAGIGAIVGFVQGFFTSVIAIFTQLWDELVGHSIIPDMLDDILREFTRLPDEILTVIVNFIAQTISKFTDFQGQVTSTVQNLIGDIVSDFQGLVSQAGTWASDMMQNFVGGIQNAIGAVKGAVGNVASAIAGMLHHTTPEVGPLAGDDKWASDMMDNFVTGITGNTGRVKQAISELTGIMSQGLNPAFNLSANVSSGAASGSGLLGGDSLSTTLLAQILAELQKQTVTATTSSHSSTVHQTNHITGKTVDKYRFVRELDILQGQAHENALRGGL